MIENIRNSKNTKVFLLLSLLALTALSFTTVAHAYGKENYQVTFSGNCNNSALCGGRSGFWGWCSFGPWTGTPAASGSDADCQSTNYFHSVALNFPTLHTSIMGTAWKVETGFTGAPDFFITAGTFTASGPTVVNALASGFGAALLSAGCTISGETVTCPISPATELPPPLGLGIYNPDTGIVFFMGHFQITDCSAFGLPPSPGCHYNQQVTQIG